MEKCTVNDLERMTLDKTFDKNIKPYRFDSDTSVRVGDWTELTLSFVKWLIHNKHLNSDKLPIPNYAGNGKYFINNRPVHEKRDMDGCWQNIGLYNVDTKYNAAGHIKNILSTLKHLGIQNPSFTITFSRY